MEAKSNSFEIVLREQRKGGMAGELSEKLQALTQACMSTGRGGSLTLKIKLTPASADGGAMSVTDAVEVKLPETPKKNSLFYTTEDGLLVRNNPDQKEFALKVVEGQPASAEPEQQMAQ